MSTENNKHLENLSEIRSIMERSSSFLSLSGLSGIFAGIAALAGAAFAYWYAYIYNARNIVNKHIRYYELTDSVLIVLVIDAIIVLIIALFAGYYFTHRNAKRKGLKLWDTTAKNTLSSLAIPLITGGIFSLILIVQGSGYLVSATTLIFYGLALLNASKYTLKEVKYLGIFEITLGLVATSLIGYGLFFWAFGFGVLHIVYGILMYVRYEKNEVKG